MAIITDPDWIDPEETTFDVEKPIRSEQGVMLAGNPIAIALGKPGAPRNQPGSLSIYLGSVSAAGGTAAGLSDLDGIDVITFVTSGAAPQDGCGFRTSVDNGATWSSWRTLLAPPETGLVVDRQVLFGNCTIALQSGWWSSRGVGKGNPASDYQSYQISNDGTFTPGGVVDAVQFRYVGTIKIFGLGAGA